MGTYQSEMSPQLHVKTKRIYEPASGDDGRRVLVDRLWPRGVSKSEAKLDAWDRELAPSTELRQWFAHRPERFPEFRRRYLAELSGQPESLSKLRQSARQETVTLLYAAHDQEHNEAVVLASALRRGVPRASN
jgi:uncharacterized protein YeaO (DUF488 family)